MEPLFLLALLACPVAMGAVMWLMARGMRAPNPPTPGDASLAELRAEQARLAEAVEELEREHAVPPTVQPPARVEYINGR